MRVDHRTRRVGATAISAALLTLTCLAPDIVRLSWTLGSRRAEAGRDAGEGTVGV
jgi:hypothetical protein